MTVNLDVNKSSSVVSEGSETKHVNGILAAFYSFVESLKNTCAILDANGDRVDCYGKSIADLGERLKKTADKLALIEKEIHSLNKDDDDFISKSESLGAQMKDLTLELKDQEVELGIERSKLAVLQNVSLVKNGSDFKAIINEAAYLDNQFKNGNRSR